MSDHVLVHMNVVRPIGAFSAAHPNAIYFFQQLPKVFAQARQDGDLLWHNHGVRAPDGQFLDMEGLLAYTAQKTEDNCHIMTMAGWKDVQAMHRFTYREPLHINGMKTLRDWVDRSEGPTMVMWWVPRGTRVSLDDAWKKLVLLRGDGPSPEAFSLQTRFPCPD